MSESISAPVPHTVLVVDDEVPLARMLREILVSEGIEVLVADSAEAALALLEEQVPSLALVDVMMPGISGIELCRRMKRDARTANVPVVLISALSSATVINEGLDAGADDYLLKPIDRAIVRFRVRSHLRLHDAQAEEQRLRGRIAIISKATRDAIVLLDREGTVAHWNESAEAMFGYSRAEALGRRLQDLVVPDAHLALYRDAWPRFDRGDLGATAGLPRELVAMTRRGRELPVELSLSSTVVDGEYWAVGILRDISERKRTEERFRVLFEGSRDAMVTMVPPHWLFTQGNPAAVALFGARDVDDLSMHGPWDYSPELQPDGQPSSEAAAARIHEALTTGSTAFDWVHCTPSGTEFTARVLLTRIYLDGEDCLLATVRDITAEKLLQAELGHARKLEAVGQLAAGIAHEINTPIQYLSDSVHFQKDVFETLLELVPLYQQAIADGPDSDAARRAAELAEEADLPFLMDNTPSALDRCFDGLSRVTSIVRAMKEFAHPDEREMVAADLNRAIESTLTIARHEYKYVADVETSLGDIPLVPCHIGDLNQVVLNLVVNAAHAVGDVVGTRGVKGTITVRTWRDGGHVCISIADTGSGIPEAIAHRVFDPFFTTKPVGQGSGQGLAIARSIVVERHHGDLRFESTPGQGTTFYIRLPIDQSASAKT